MAAVGFRCHGEDPVHSRHLETDSTKIFDLSTKFRRDFVGVEKNGFVQKCDDPLKKDDNEDKF